MDNTITLIDSETAVLADQHFRIMAGPGAGKTHWLINQIRYVLAHSKRLGCYRKIACITYTNVGVDTIIKRLDFTIDRVEVSTIHGFIYANIIKPYAAFIPLKYGLNVGKIDGHDDHIVSKKRIKDWVENHPNASSLSHPYSVNQLTQMPNNLEGLGRWLSSLHYVFNGDDLELIADNSEAYYIDGNNRRNLGKTTCLDKLSPGLTDYKQQFWKHGILHHDDVMFFGYLLLKEHPFILSVLRAKFPYFFIDEFQDTSPIQAAILKMIGEQVTVVGIIGDAAQSIYSFQGASPAAFKTFALPGLGDYMIKDNRRSTDAIITLLNHIRKDIQQEGIRKEQGTQPILYVGGTDAALAEIARIFPAQPIATLAWDNITANAMKQKMNSAIPTRDLLVEFANKDSNYERRGVITSMLEAVELAKRQRFKEAIKEMERNFRSITDKEQRKKTAFKYLSLLLSKYDSFRGQPFINFYHIVKTQIRADITTLTRGNAFTFFNDYTYEQLAVCIKIIDDASINRTIHKAKGDEFDKVLVMIGEQSHLSFLLNPDLNKEQHRLFYVAISRGRDNLFMNVPTMNIADESKIDHVVQIVRV